jgi:hypothetical protein
MQGDVKLRKMDSRKIERSREHKDRCIIPPLHCRCFLPAGRFGNFSKRAARVIRTNLLAHLDWT